MAENPEIRVKVDLGNAAEQADAFALALSRVDQKARGIFVTLRDLSQRYQQQGFLGMADQRALEQGVRQWERATALMGLRVQGAQARAEETGTAGARAAVTRLEEHQEALATLRGTVGTLFGGRVPASPLQARQMAAGIPPTPFAAGRYSPWAPPNVSTGWGGWTSMLPGPGHATIGPGFGGWTSMMPAPPSPGLAGWTSMMPRVTPPGGGLWSAWGGMLPPSGPPPGGLWSAWGGMLPSAGPPGGGLGLWTSMLPPTPWGQRAWGGARGALAQAPHELAQGFGSLYGAVHGPARRGMQIAGGVAGVGLYGTLTEAMELYRERSRGIIDTGMQLDTNFARVGTTLDRLRDKYKLLARDVFGAQQAMGHALGRPDDPALAAALRMGVAYGMAPEQAASLAGTLMMRGTGVDPLARGFAGARAAYGRGGLPMAGGPLATDITAIAGWGGAAAVPMDIGYYGAWAGLIGGLGQRYREPGQTGETFGRIAAGVTNAPDPTTMALRMRAIGDLHRSRVARGLGHNMTFGEGEGKVNVDLRTIEGRQIAMENAMQSRDVLQQYWETSQNLFGTSGDQAALGFRHYMLGNEVGPTEAFRIRQRLTRGGGPAGLLRQGNVAVEQQTAEARTKARGEAEEFAPQRREATLQPLLEALGKPIQKASDDLKEALGGLAKSIGDGTFTWKDLNESLKKLDASLMIVGSLIALGANSNVGVGIGLGIAGAGAVNRVTEWLGGLPDALGPVGQGLPPGMRLLKPGEYPSLQPTRPSP